MFIPYEIMNIILEKRTDYMLFDLMEKVGYGKLCKIVKYDNDLMKRSLLFFKRKSVEDFDLLRLTEDLITITEETKDHSIMFNIFKSIFENLEYVDIEIYETICDFIIKYIISSIGNYWKKFMTLCRPCEKGDCKNSHILIHTSYFTEGYKNLIPGLKDLNFTEEQIDTSFQKSYQYLETLGDFVKDVAKENLDSYTPSDYYSL